VSSLASTARIYREVLGNRSLRRTLVAFFAFNAQEYAIWIAITLYAYGRGGAATAGLVAVAQLVPAALIAPLASTMGDRLRRDRALSIGYTIQAATAALTALALWFAPPIVAYAAAVLSACSITLTRPVHNAILPELSETPEQLTASNSVSSTAEGLGIFAGPVLNSILISIEGPGLVCVVFGALMAGAAILTARLDLHEVPSEMPEEHAETETETAPEGLTAAAAAGLRELRRDTPAGVLTLFGGAQFFVLGVLDIFYAVLAIDVLGVGEQGAGLLAASVGVGGLVGATATALLIGRSRLASPIQIAVGVMGGATAAVALVAAFGPVIALLALAGAARSFFDVAARTLLQRSVRDEVLARVFGLQEAMLMVGLAAGSAVAPLLIAMFGDRGAFVAAGVMLPLIGLAVFPALRALDRRAVLPDPERFQLLRSIDMFAFMPQPALERVTGALVPLRFPAGEVIIREGEAGDRFYVLTHGGAVVEARGHEVAHLETGDYFGEIALLRDVPRTATVRAATDVELLALERHDFLGAVGGSRRSGRSADSEIDRRLGEIERLGD